MLGNRGHVSSSMSDNAASSSSSSSSSFTVGASSSSSSTMRNGGASIGGGSGSGNGGVGNGVTSGSGSTSGGLGGGNGPLNEIESSNQRFSKEPYDSVKVSSMENDENRNKITDLNGINIHVGNDNYYDNHEEFSDWVCTICTVINSPTDEMCLTCETLRHQDEWTQPNQTKLNWIHQIWFNLCTKIRFCISKCVPVVWFWLLFSSVFMRSMMAAINVQHKHNTILFEILLLILSINCKL